MKKKFFTVPLLAIVLSLGLSLPIIQAQELALDLKTSAGLSLRYPDGWIGSVFEPLNLMLNTPEGWYIQIQVGDRVVFDDPRISAEDALAIQAQRMDAGSLDVAAAQPLTLEDGAAGYLANATLSNDERSNIPALVAVFNLPDGTIVSAFIVNNRSFEAITPQAEADFLAIVGSLRLDESEAMFVPEGAAALVDMREGELRFGNGISLQYPQGWVINSDDGLIRDSAVLLFGESVFNYEAMLVANISEESVISVEQGRDIVFGFSGMLYTGREDFDISRDLLVETLDDGTIIETLDISEAEQVLGNSYLVILPDAPYWAWFTLTIVSQPNAAERLAEVEAMVRSLVYEPRPMETEDAAMGETAGLSATLTPVQLPSDLASLTPRPMSCTYAISLEDINQAAPYAVFVCPAGCVARGEIAGVWGTDIYTLDSAVCTAAVHAGAISDAQGGAVLATWLAGQDEYPESTRNGVSSSAWGSWGDSFRVDGISNP